jgi:alcohol dehydrogenase class IV
MMMNHLPARMIQSFMRVVATFIRIPEPKMYLGHKLFPKVVDILLYHQRKKLLIVTDATILSLKLIDPLFALLTQHHISYWIYSETQVNPTIHNLEAAKTMFLRQQCDSIIGFGGGSSMDCAKGAAALIASGKQVAQLKGLLKVRKKPPFMLMIPTTAGTGSEATVAVVVSNPKTKEKYAINDPVLVPQYAILDSALTLGLPRSLTAQTGLDALTHAIEAFLGRSNTKFTISHAKEAVLLIHQHLLNAYRSPLDEPARRGMLAASYHAGLAFTRAYVGYVHGIAHTLGGFYQFPHGLANAIILPHVLDAYGKSIQGKLAIMADWLTLTDVNAPPVVKAKAFKEWLATLLTGLDIPKTMPNLIQTADIPLMIQRVIHEVIPLYPVPTYLSKQTLNDIYQTIGG